MKVCPLADPKLAGDLVAKGIPLEAASALLVLPAVYVAWADGEVSKRETKAVWGAARAAQLKNEFALGLVNRWLTNRPADLEELLDLTWRLYECVPAVQQRFGSELAFSMASITARYSSGLFGLYRIGREERQALTKIEHYFAGRGLETARRKALTWGHELEGTAPGLSLVHHDQFADAAQAASLEGSLLRALPTIESAPGMWRFSQLGDVLEDDELNRLRKMGVKERKKRLLPPVREGFAQLDATERALLGEPESLQALTPWQACCLAILLVCRSATGYSSKHTFEELLAVFDSDDEDAKRAAVEAQLKELRDLLVHDVTPSPKLLHTLLDPAQIEIVCRHYVRLTCAAYQGIKRAAPQLADTYLIPLHGRYDLRVRQAHAWCLFVDAKRGVSCALDPTAADGFWDAGRSESFLNPPLSAFTYANASSLVARLLTAKSRLSHEAALDLATQFSNPPRLAARVLAQPAVTCTLEADQLERLLGFAEREGAPDDFVQRVLECHTPMHDAFRDLGWEAQTRANLGSYLVRSGLVPASQLGDLNRP